MMLYFFLKLVLLTAMAAQGTCLMTSHCYVLLIATTWENEAGELSHGFQLEGQFINALQCGCE